MYQMRSNAYMLFIHLCLSLLTVMFLRTEEASANSSLAVERSGEFLVVFAQPELPLEGEVLLVQLTGQRSYAMRILPETKDHPHDECVTVADKPDLAKSKFMKGDCRHISYCEDGRHSARRCKEAEVFVRPSKATQLHFPGKIIGGFKRKKPIIYLYPKETTEVSVTLDFDGVIEASHPALSLPEKRWKVIAHPDGRIRNKEDGEEFSSLFWEGSGQEFPYDSLQGFVVPGEEIREFLQTSLRKLGLTSREYNEFIAYWYPLLKDNRFVFIHFATGEYEENVKLKVLPAPDSVIRIFMIYRPLDEAIRVVPQRLESISRHGFTVVEWGGGEAEPPRLLLK